MTTLKRWLADNGHRPGKTPAGKKAKAPHADARLTAVRVRAELGW